MKDCYQTFEYKGAFIHSCMEGNTAHVKSQIGYEIRQHKTIEGAKRYITKMKKAYHV